MPQLMHTTLTHWDCACRTRMFFHFGKSRSGENELVVQVPTGTRRVQSFQGTIPAVVACPNCGRAVDVPQLQQRSALDGYFEELGEETEQVDGRQ